MFATCLTIKNFWFCLELEPTVIAFHPFYMIIKYSWISFYLSFGSIAHVFHPHYISMKCTRCSAGCRLCRKESVINYHSPLFNYWITGPLKKTKKKTYLTNQELNVLCGSSEPKKAGRRGRRTPWCCHHADPAGQNPGFRWEWVVGLGTAVESGQ